MTLPTLSVVPGLCGTYGPPSLCQRGATSHRLAHSQRLSSRGGQPPGGPRLHEPAQGPAYLAFWA